MFPSALHRMAGTMGMLFGDSAPQHQTGFPQSLADLIPNYVPPQMQSQTAFNSAMQLQEALLGISASCVRSIDPVAEPAPQVECVTEIETDQILHYRIPPPRSPWALIEQMRRDFPHCFVSDEERSAMRADVERAREAAEIRKLELVAAMRRARDAAWLASRDDSEHNQRKGPFA